MVPSGKALSKFANSEPSSSPLLLTSLDSPSSGFEVEFNLTTWSLSSLRLFGDCKGGESVFSITWLLSVVSTFSDWLSLFSVIAALTSIPESLSWVLIEDSFWSTVSSFFSSVSPFTVTGLPSTLSLFSCSSEGFCGSGASPEGSDTTRLLVCPTF